MGSVVVLQQKELIFAVLPSLKRMIPGGYWVFFAEFAISAVF
jgi:hypothetical protein